MSPDALCRDLWWRVVFAYLAAGLAFAGLLQRLSALAVLIATSILLGALGGLLYALNRDLYTPWPACLRTAGSFALTATAAVAGLVGWSTVSPAAAGSLFAVLCLTSPPVVRFVQRRHTARRRHGRNRSAGVVDVLRGPVTGSMTETELCVAWRRSYLELQESLDVAGRMSVIELRADLLAELAARHPEGFARWMSSGARAASDPTRFIGPGPTPPPPSDAG